MAAVRGRQGARAAPLIEPRGPEQHEDVANREEAAGEVKLLELAHVPALNAMAEEAAVSRLYGGIHFRTDIDAGLERGRRVGTVALPAYRVQGR
jgi:hypothetical protein